jgi:hypothetical protein
LVFLLNKKKRTTHKSNKPWRLEIEEEPSSAEGPEEASLEALAEQLCLEQQEEEPFLAQNL